nr:uncharacterized protein LOC115258278 [Aedes albopictus]
MDPSNDKLTVSRDCRFLSKDEVRTAESQQGSIVDYPFKLLEQQKPDAPVIPANVDDSDDESDESDFRGFETSYDDANEEPYVEDAPEESGTSDNEEEEQAVGGDADVSVVRRSERTTKGIPPQRRTLDEMGTAEESG